MKTYSTVYWFCVKIQHQSGVWTLSELFLPNWAVPACPDPLSVHNAPMAVQAGAGLVLACQPWDSVTGFSVSQQQN